MSSVATDSLPVEEISLLAHFFNGFRLFHLIYYRPELTGSLGETESKIKVKTMMMLLVYPSSWCLRRFQMQK